MALATGTVQRLFETVPPDLSHTSLVLDPAGDRGIALGGNEQGTFETWQLGLDANGLWQTLLADGPAPARVGYAAVVDSVRHRLLVFGGAREGISLNDVWVLSLGEHPAWSALDVTNPPPPMIYSSGVIDPVGDRMIVMGISLDPVRNELWSLDLKGASWERLEPTGDPPPLLAQQALVYDPLRHRVLVVGGADTTFDRFSVRAFDLGAEPMWTKVPTTGAPPQRTGHAALFDAVRDRLVIYGGQEGASMNDVWALDFGGDLTWRMLQPTGGAPYSGAAIHDARRDRMVVLASTGPLGLPTATWQLRWGQDLIPAVTCPGSMAWQNPGSPLLLHYSITNTSKTGQVFDWVLTSERVWPGFPTLGTVPISSQQSVPIDIEILVPDSAAIGLNRLRFSVRGADGNTTFCEHFLGDLATPALVTPLAPEIHDFTLILRWWVARSDWGSLDVERRERTGEWQVVGVAAPDGRDILRFSDDTVVPGVPYAYRLVVPMIDGDARIGYVETTLPSTRLAIRVERLGWAARVLTLEYSLPSMIAARLEVFDLSGRRVCSHQIAEHSGGRQIVDLDIGGLAAGVYFVRLSQAGRDAQARFAVVR